MFNSLNIGLSPNLRIQDSFLALRLLFQPWRWKIGKEVAELEEWFKKYLGCQEAVAFNSGRSAEYAILKSLGIKEGDEVLLQAFTCVAVPNSVLWLGAKPVFVDVEEETLNMDPKDLERKITSHSKAIIVQHTFGIPAKMDEILRIGKTHHLLVIEDCAHIIKKNLQGDAVFYSFGRDKAVSSVFGGMAIGMANGKDMFLRNRQMANLREIQEKLQYPSCYWIFQQLLHPIVSAIILPLYNLGLGKIILWTLQKLHLLSFPVYPQEKSGGRPNIFPAKMPNALAILALNQLDQLEKFEKKRKEIVKIYINQLKELGEKGHIKLVDGSAANIVPLLRYPILVDRPDELRRYAKQKGIILGSWYSHIIDPKDVNLEKIGYKKGSCLVAENVAKRIVNLPTYPRMDLCDAEKVVAMIESFYRI